MITNIFLLIGAFLLVLINAFFVAAEFGMVKLRHTRIATIKRHYGFRGKILAQVHKHLDAYLSACQLGITLASLGLGWLGEPAFAYILEPILELIGMNSPDLIRVISFFVAFSIISFLHIVIGELVPKSLAIRQSEIVSIWTAVPLYLFYWLMFPAIWVLNSCANTVLKLLRLDVSKEQGYSPEEIKLILNTSHHHQQLSKQEIQLLRHSMEFLDLEVIDVMRPIEDMVSLNADQTIEQALSIILEQRYSRYPLYDNVTKEIMGIVHVKDILLALKQNKQNQVLKSIMRPVLKVSKHLSAIKLLNKLQEGMPHFALVYMGRETPIGFVTLDNIFQVIVGRVRDEFHKIEESWTKAPDDAFIMNGNSALYVLERALNIDIELDEETENAPDTIFGLILAKIERFPQQGETIDFGQFSIVIKKMKGHKLLEVAVYPKPQENE